MCSICGSVSVPSGSLGNGRLPGEQAYRCGKPPPCRAPPARSEGGPGPEGGHTFEHQPAG